MNSAEEAVLKKNISVCEISILFGLRQPRPRPVVNLSPVSRPPSAQLTRGTLPMGEQHGHFSTDTGPSGWGPTSEKV